MKPNNLLKNLHYNLVKKIFIILGIGLSIIITILLIYIIGIDKYYFNLNQSCTQNTLTNYCHCIGRLVNDRCLGLQTHSLIKVFMPVGR